METGPVDVYIIGFPGNKFTGRIAPAIGELVDNGEIIRVLDLLFVMKDEDGVVTTLAIEDLDEEGPHAPAQHAPARALAGWGCRPTRPLPLNPPEAGGKLVPWRSPTECRSA